MSDAKRTSEQIAPELGEVYWFWKDAEDEKEKLRKEFFDAVTRSHAESDLAHKTFICPDQIVAIDEALQYAEQYNPGWNAYSTVAGAHPYHVVMREDPALKAGVEVVEVKDDFDPAKDGVWDRKGQWHPGYVVTKSIVGGSAMIDTDRMQKWDQALWHELTQYQGFPPDDQLETSVIQTLEEINWPRVIGHLDKDGVAKVKPYTYEGKRTVKLLVRYAKDDDLPDT